MCGVRVCNAHLIAVIVVSRRHAVFVISMFTPALCERLSVAIRIMLGYVYISEFHWKNVRNKS